ALQGELETAGDGDTVDRTDHRLRDHRDEAVEPVVVESLRSCSSAPLVGGRRRFAAELLEVDAAAEGGIGARDDDRVDAGIVACGAAPIPERIPQCTTERVAGLGPVEGDGGDAVLHVHEHDGFGHGAESTTAARSTQPARLRPGCTLPTITKLYRFVS